MSKDRLPMHPSLKVLDTEKLDSLVNFIKIKRESVSKFSNEEKEKMYKDIFSEINSTECLSLFKEEKEDMRDILHWSIQKLEGRENSGRKNDERAPRIHNISTRKPTGELVKYSEKKYWDEISQNVLYEHFCVRYKEVTIKTEKGREYREGGKDNLRRLLSEHISRHTGSEAAEEDTSAVYDWCLERRSRDKEYRKPGKPGKPKPKEISKLKFSFFGSSTSSKRDRQIMQSS
ncbi:hypothetical protein HYALB_00004489 [Hymenoscyphus albidus]|uniref:Uncharacterized protein n=1 Tax=Hymenoscyphus albidus TaxID=595503 RepID=A0A9N9M067_9HELO|nr:hypothetical protein HYALB_00004489 [Hymenoscyphus albidus]